MASYTFQCPSCGAPIIPRENASVLNCPYCHAPVIVPEELRQASTTANWSTLVYDGFISNHNEWSTGSQTSEYFNPLNRSIAEGRYRWEAKVGKAPSIITAWLKGYPVSDFHLTANCKHIHGRRAGSSWGVVFRIQNNQNYYHFRVRDDRFFAFSTNKDNQWLPIVKWTSTNLVKPNGVNQLEVIGCDAQFTFLINGQIVSEANDDHFSSGQVGLSIEGYNAGEEITFDFMDILLRAP